jgi:hypothetical protein
MVGQMLTGIDLELSQIINAAMEHDYTRYGEMFSGELEFVLFYSCSRLLFLPVCASDKNMSFSYN